MNSARFAPPEGGRRILRLRPCRRPPLLPVDGWLLAGWVAAGRQDCSWLADRGWLAGWPIPLEVEANLLVPGPYY